MTEVMVLMRCVKAKRWMSLQIDGSLSSDRVGKLERHVRQCVGCQAERRMLARIHEVLIAEPETLVARPFRPELGRLKLVSSVLLPSVTESIQIAGFVTNERSGKSCNFCQVVLRFHLQS